MSSLASESTRPEIGEGIGVAAEALGVALLRPEVLAVIGPLPGDQIGLRTLLLGSVGRAVGRTDSSAPLRHTETVTVRDAAEQLNYSDEWIRKLGKRGELALSQPGGFKTGWLVEQTSVDRFLDLRSLKAFFRQLDEEDRKCRQRISRIIGSQTELTASRTGSRRSSTT